MFFQYPCDGSCFCACAMKTSSELVSLRSLVGKRFGVFLFFPVDSATMLGLELVLSSYYLHVTVLLIAGYNSTLVAEGKFHVMI